MAAGTSIFSTIIVPVDGSEQSEVALPIAFEMARTCNAGIVFCAAYDMPGIQMEYAVAGYPDTTLIERVREQCEVILADAAERAHDAGLVRVQTVLADRNPVDAIIALVKERGADLIVMGSHGRGGLSRLLLGSTTEGVMRRSPVPVLVVRWPGKVAAKETAPARSAPAPSFVAAT